jgi:hypothetical protein
MSEVIIKRERKRIKRGKEEEGNEREGKRGL